MRFHLHRLLVSTSLAAITALGTVPEARSPRFATTVTTTPRRRHRP